MRRPRLISSGARGFPPGATAFCKCFGTRHESPMTSMADADVFTTERPLLFSIAYRMLGSASDAEDVVQDAWVRFSGTDRSAIRSPKAFATTIVTRLCLDRLKSAR